MAEISLYEMLGYEGEKMKLFENIARKLMKDYKPSEREQYEFEHYTLIIEPKIDKLKKAIQEGLEI